jgi:hemolysin activation/secretion protein
MNIYSKIYLVWLSISLMASVGLGNSTDANSAKPAQNQSSQPLLPEDTSARLSVRQLSISGNTLISTKELLEKIPAIYNSSTEPISKAQSRYLYDFDSIRRVVSDPNQPQEVSARTIQGFTQYILSIYQGHNYSGIRVYVPKDTLDKDGKLIDGILAIRIIEATVGEVKVTYHNTTEPNEIEKGYLRRSAVEDWSPVRSGKVANQKALDYFVNLLNLNPDRHVTVAVTGGTEPNTLDFTYDIVEANPWHYFIQVDNSGTHDRQWAPRAGIINTNLLGYDDKLTAIYQAKPDSTFDENYSVFGSYDFPIIGPRLRLNIFAGHSEFDITPQSGLFDFLGRGTFYGALLRYNLLQNRGWFLDITGSLSREESKVTPSLFPSATSDVEADLLGTGIELHRSDDLSNTSISLNREQSLHTSSQADFDLARLGADTDFSIYTLAGKVKISLA